MSDSGWAECWIGLLHMCTDGAEKAITAPDFTKDGWMPPVQPSMDWDVACDVCGYTWTWKDMTWTPRSS